MSTPRLTYDLLSRLVDLDRNHNLKAIPKGVTRLGDESHDKNRIQLGETVVFVASFELAIAEEAQDLVCAELGVDKSAVQASILEIDREGNVVSMIHDISLDQAEVSRWLGEHFEIAFQVNGGERSPSRPFRRQPVEAEDYGTVEPWVQQISLISVAGEVVDIDFQLKARIPRVKAQEVALSRSKVPITFDQAELKFSLYVDGNYDTLASLNLREYWIDLRSHTHPDLKLRLKIENATPREPYKSLPPAAGRSGVPKQKSNRTEP